jgi:small GTP-binding protein
LTVLLIAYAAVLGYALIAWLPALVENYDRIAAEHPNWAFAYLGAVAAGGLALGGASIALFWTMWRNTAAKTKRLASRAKNPSAMSAGQRETELADNLASSRELANDEHASQALRDALKAQLESLEQKRTRQRIEIVAFGTISSGKSALLNALAGRDAFATDVLGGTTTSRCEIPWPDSDSVVLVDTPGLAEVRGESRAATAAAAAKNADIVLLVVDGPLKAYEVDLAEVLRSMEKRIVVCLNKEDWYEEDEERSLIEQIAGQLAGLQREDIVAVRAVVTTRPRIRVLSDGTEEPGEVEVPADVRPLAKRMLQVVRRDGGDLLLANLLLQSRGMVDEAKLQVRKHLDERADQIITRYMWAAGGAAGVNPIPILDVAGGSAITLKMILDLARVYRQPLDADLAVKMLEQLTKNLLALVGGVAAAPAVATMIGALLKTVPGVGTLAGGLVQGLVQALVTRWIGNVFCEYLRNEMNPPPGGLTEAARQEWQRLTSADALRRLIQSGREHLKSGRNVN